RFLCKRIDMTIKERLYKNRDYIASKYQSGVSCTKLGEEFSCNSGTIYYFLKDIGVEIKKHVNRGILEKNKDEIIQKWLSSDLGLRKFAESIGVGHGSLAKFLGKHGVRQIPTLNTFIMDNSPTIAQMYLDGLSTCEIAEIYDCNGGQIWRALRKEKVKCRPIAKYTCDEDYM